MCAWVAMVRPLTSRIKELVMQVRRALRNFSHFLLFTAASTKSLLEMIEIRCQVIMDVV